MDKIAYVSGDMIIYWNSVVLTLATMVAICFFLAFYIGKCGNAVAGFAAVPLCIVLGVVMARLLHWYSRSDSYDGFLKAMTDYTSGGYSLLGVFVGCLLAASLLRLIFLHRNLPEMLDCMSLAGLSGICVGRLASFFNAADRGNILENFQTLPFAWPVTNTVSGAVEYRLATFLIQAAVALVLFAAMSMFYVRGQKKNLRDGDTCLIVLLIYSASQVVLDSTRYDSLFFRSNGFVSIVQVVSAVVLAVVIVLFSIRMVRARCFRFWQPVLWLAIGALMGGAGYMEYYVQRRGNEAVFAYSVMSACLLGVIGLTLLIRMLAVTVERKLQVDA